MSEEWRQVPGFNGYMVSNMGRVRSKRNPEAYLKPFRQGGRSGEYLAVSLYDKRIPSRVYVHRLVLLVFVGPEPDGKEASHINGDSSDNRLDNLEWATVTENERRKREHGTDPSGERNPNARLSDAQIVKIRELVAKGLRRCDVAAMFGIHSGHVGNIVNGVRR